VANLPLPLRHQLLSIWLLQVELAAAEIWVAEAGEVVDIEHLLHFLLQQQPLIQ
jgi:hypothetical protein